MRSELLPDVETFESYRSLLFAIAYRMLGSVVEAEDVVQEAYLRYQATPPDTIRSDKAFLSTIVTRLCLDQLKSARAQRETYIGPWLPEPLLTAELADPALSLDRIGERESISLAFLVLLESLTPLERAVFLLHEVFDYSYAEVADIVGRGEATCRQLFHRARQHVIERRPRFPASPTDQERLTTSFLRAASAGDLTGLLDLLAEDVTAWSDGGGKVAAARKPIHGREAVARFLIGIASKAPPDTRVAFAELNGQPACLIYAAERLFGTITVETDGQQILALRFVNNPDKLQRLAQAVANGAQH